MSINWHERFTQQSLWTQPLRDYLLRKISPGLPSRTLEVGCGTGAILSDYLNHYSGVAHGVDIHFPYCEIATRNPLDFHIANGDVLNLPYESCAFDLVFCHYFLLWLKCPADALHEIKRVLKPGGYFMAFAEPDYGARIDHPPALARLGDLQTDSLIRQGANPRLGRELPALASGSGFVDIQYGVSCFERSSGDLPNWWDSEWQVLKNDLNGLINPIELDQLQVLDRHCWEDGSRVLWVPTFYLSCRKPSQS